jgi:hypothetical protein
VASTSTTGLGLHISRARLLRHRRIYGKTTECKGQGIGLQDQFLLSLARDLEQAPSLFSKIIQTIQFAYLKSTG